MPELSVLWRRELGSAVFAAPAIHEGSVFLGGAGGVLQRLDLATGARVWEQRFRAGLNAAPVVAEDVAYLGCDDGHLYALALTGEPEVRWRHTTGGPIVAAPLVWEDGIVFTSWDGGVRGIDRDGTRRWRIRTKRPAVEAPILVEQEVAFVDDRGVSTADLASGAITWRSPDLGDLDTSIVAGTGGLLVYGTTIGSVHAIDRHAVAPRWSFATNGHRPAAACVSTALVVVACDSGRVVGLDALSGEQRWEQRVGPRAHAPVAVPGADGLGMLVFDGEGTATFSSIEDGRPCDRLALKGAIFSHATAPDRSVVVASDAGLVWRIGIGGSR